MLNLKGMQALAQANEAYEDGRRAYTEGTPITAPDGWNLPYVDEWKKGWRDMKYETESGDTVCT